MYVVTGLSLRDPPFSEHSESRLHFLDVRLRGDPHIPAIFSAEYFSAIAIDLGSCRAPFRPDHQGNVILPSAILSSMTLSVDQSFTNCFRHPGLLRGVCVHLAA